MRSSHVCFFKMVTIPLSRQSAWYFLSLHSSLIRTFLSNILKNLAFTISKYYFYNFNTSFYNIPNIKHFIFFTTLFKYSFFNIFIHFLLFLTLPLSLSPIISPSFSTRSRSFSLSLLFCSQNLHGLRSPLTTALNNFILCFISEFKLDQSLDFDPNAPCSTTEPTTSTSTLHRRH